MATESLTIVQVSPYVRGSRHEIDRFVTRSAEELTERGHRVVVAAPSERRTAIRDSRRAIRAAASDPERLFAEGGPVSLAVGQRIP